MLNVSGFTSVAPVPPSKRPQIYPALSLLFPTLRFFDALESPKTIATQADRKGLMKRGSSILAAYKHTLQSFAVCLLGMLTLHCKS